MKAIVDEVTLSKSGKSYLAKIGGQGYFCKLDSKIDKAVGQAIDFSVDPQNYQGKTINWVRDWDFDRNPPAPPKEAAVASPRPSSGLLSGGDRFYMPFVSNTVAHAIAAGLIKEPTQIGPWARAAYRVVVVDLEYAFEEKTKGKFEDSMTDIPF